MSKLSRELNTLIREFWADNWRKINPPGAPTPISNDADFADFSNWLEERERKMTK